MFKKCKVVILTTKTISKIRLDNHVISRLSFEPHIQGLSYDGFLHSYQHLYILSNDEPEANDWISDGKKLWQLPVKLDGYINLFKVIASTDSSLSLHCKYCNEIKVVSTGLCPKCTRFSDSTFPSIPQSFIDKYVTEYNRRNKIEEVMVEYDEEVHNYLNKNTSMFETYTLRLNSDNTINIKSIKDSWTREEVIALCKTAIIVGSHSSTFDFNEWIESNL